MNPQQILNYKKKLSAHAKSGVFKSAARLATKIVKASPRDIGAWWALAQFQEQLGQFESAIRSCYQVCQGPSQIFEQAVAKAVTLAVAHGEWNLGVAPGQEWVKLRPTDIGVWTALAKCWVELMRYEEAIPVLEKLLSLDPNHIYGNQSLVTSYMNTLQQEKALEHLAELVERSSASVAQFGLLAYNTNFSDSLSETEVATSHQRFAKFLSENRSVRNRKVSASSGRKRLGFVSEDFRVHSVAYFFLPIIENFKFDDWEVYCYSCVSRPDDMTEKIKRHSDHWVECQNLDHDTLLDRVADDELDVLVDLQGVSGASRLSIFMSRLASVQVSYLGYPNTTGVENMDFRLTDITVDPVERDASFYSENLYRLKDSFLCYRPEGLEGEVGALPALSNGYVTFCSFNSIQKYSARTLSLWAAVLGAVADSKLLLKSAPLFDPLLQKRVLAFFETKGISEDRIIFKGWAASKADHMSIYNEADIHLDCFPYNGTTTTCESIWQGVPLLALAGDTHRSRVGLGIMSQLGLGDWVAATEQEYVYLAVEKASDIEGLSKLRAEIRSRMQSSPLMDEAGFAADFRNALDDMLEIQREKKA